MIAEIGSNLAWTISVCVIAIATAATCWAVNQKKEGEHGDVHGHDS